MVQGISTSTADKRKLTRTHDSRCNKITCSPKKIHEIGGLLNFKRSPWKHVEWDFRASTNRTSHQTNFHLFSRFSAHFGVLSEVPSHAKNVEDVL